MNKYGLHGKLTAKAGNREKLAQILLEAARLLSETKGCQLYVIGIDDNDEEAVWVTEVWDTKEDHENSLKVESTRALIAQAIPILDGMPEKGQELRVLGGLGIH
ncbi:MAG: antibiotic biosynthesis monooxygenase [Chitinophagaceae bacterium]|nr:antibiotic biosynthesis monooxygenase [Chitinophagaceae bacterium]